MEELTDCYWWKQNRKILTYHEISVPGLKVFGYNLDKAAKAPLNLHYHKNSVEITFIIQGSQIFNVKGEDYLVTGGEVFITYANEPHSTGSYPQGICEQFWMQLDLSDKNNFLGMAQYWADSLYTSITKLNNRHFKISKHFSSVLTEALYKYNSKDPLQQLQGNCDLLSFVNEVIKKQACHYVITEDIHLAIRFIEDNIYNAITVEEIANASNLSVSRLKTKFCEEVGMAPMQYLNYKKIQEAKQMIRNGENITEIAYKLQFSSSSHFSNFFRKHTSMSPSEYKKLKIRLQ